MKTVKLGGLLVIAAALFSSCVEQSDVEMHTTINPDGTCTRIVSYSDVVSKEMRDSLLTDSSLLRQQPVPECLQVDGFSYTFTRIDNGDTITTVLNHDYQTVGEMSADMPLQLNGVQLQATSEFSKHFCWFYTEYNFSEEFSCVADNFKLPITDYVDADAASYWFTGRPDVLQGLSGSEASTKLEPIENAVSNWLNDNIFQLNFDFIVSHYDSVINPPVSREQFVAQRDSFKEFVEKTGDILTADHKKLFKDFFHSDAYALFFDESPCGEALERENVKMLNVFNLSVPYTLKMPGRITDAGCGVCQNDTVIYPLTGERLIPHNYIISATSRDRHVWAYIVTVLVIVIAVCSLLYRKS
jgi:hypothetical protein